MQGLSEQQLLRSLIALAVILVAARAAGELARRLRQPEVLGELFAGVILGPSVFGALLPGLHNMLFNEQGTSQVLSGFSWVGAILLLLIAGIEVDLGILRAEACPGFFGAGFSIVMSLLAGTLFAIVILGRPFQYGIFLGIVLSVTAVSVAAKILLEREEQRRRYAQVILAIGVASEVVAWPLVSVAAAIHTNAALLAGLRSVLYAGLFFLLMFTLGRAFTFWAMRRVADSTGIIRGQLSLVLVLTFTAAGITQALGLHPLLGAFVFGVLLSRAPRKNRTLVEGIQALATALFAPIFFVLAGMRVDIFQLRSVTALGAIALLLIVASAVKIVFGLLGARLGGLGSWEAAIVGVGINLKGGTDVIVAIIGVELGLLTVRTYTIYTIVAMLTVLLTPMLLTALTRRAPVSSEEQQRLEREEAARRAYVPRIERVVVPVEPQLLPALTTDVVQRIALSKHEQGEIFDVTEFLVEDGADTAPEQAIARQPSTVVARAALNAAATLRNVELFRRSSGPSSDTSDTLRAVLDAAKQHDLLVIGGHPHLRLRSLTFGPLQDALIHEAQMDVLLVASEEERYPKAEVRRILVPTNGLEYSMAAGDIAAHLAQSYGAELVLMNVVAANMDALFWRETNAPRLRATAANTLDELEFRVKRLGVPVSRVVHIADNPGRMIQRELARGAYQLVVLGAYDRGTGERPQLGKAVQTVLARSHVPALVLVSHQRQ